MIGERISHYSVVAKLGEGGMGEVYLAEDLELKRSVALKVLPAEVADDPERLARFRREAESLAAINHPNIVTIFSIEQVGDLHILTMERVEGRGLDELLPADGMPLEQLLDVGVSLSAALAASHEKGITHRDLKPANLMLTEDGRLKVLDFGLAKPRREDRSQALSGSDLLVTREQTILGTVPYMSPEQIEGGDVDGRSDVFSFGVVMYELATGRRPFQGKSTPKVIAAILEQEPVPVRKLRRDLPAGLERILERCLRKDRDERFATARELSSELASLREGRSPGRTASKAPWIAAAVALVIVAGLLVLWGGGAAGPSSAAATASIAVLPFENGGAAVDDYFAAAMTHGVAERLSTVDGLIVRRPPDGWAEKTPEEIREALSVEYLLGATVFLVEKEGSHRRVVVTPVLSRTTDGASIPVPSCERDIPDNEDIVEVHRVVANGVLDQIEARHGDFERAAKGSVPTQNTEAYSLYLKGEYFYSRRDEASLDKAQECYARAAELDPGFVLASHSAATVSSARAWYGLVDPVPVHVWLREVTEETLSRAPRLPEAWASLASIHMDSDLDFAAAERAWLKAIEYGDLRPNGYPSAHQWYGYTLSWWGRHDEALAQVTAAWEMDPVSPIITTWVGLAHYYAGRYEEAIGWMDDALELDPDFVPAHWHRTWVCGVAGRPEEALRNAERARALSDNPVFIANHAFALAVANRREEARELLARLEEIARERYVSNYHLASAYAALGDEEEAFRRLELAFQDQAMWRGAVMVDQRLLSLHDDPRFDGFVERLGL